MSEVWAINISGPMPPFTHPYAQRALGKNETGTRATNPLATARGEGGLEEAVAARAPSRFSYGRGPASRLISESVERRARAGRWRLVTRSGTALSVTTVKCDSSSRRLN